MYGNAVKFLVGLLLSSVFCGRIHASGGGVRIFPSILSLILFIVAVIVVIVGIITVVVLLIKPSQKKTALDEKDSTLGQGGREND